MLLRVSLFSTTSHHFPQYCARGHLAQNCALHLYKLDVNATEKAAEAKNLVDFEKGNITIKQRMGGVKDYPTFASLLDPLLVYFNILGFHAGLVWSGTCCSSHP